MLSKFVSLSLAFVFASSASSQSLPPANGAQPSQQPAWSDHYRKATISFGKIDSVNGVRTYSPIGTGVIVCSDPQHAFIVTAKHVFSEPGKNWLPAELAVRFSNEEKLSLTEDIGTAIALTNVKHEAYWSSLDDDSDIAALSLPATLRGKATDCVGFQDFATSDDVFDGATVFTFGYPNSGAVMAGANALVRAITRSGIIAWTDPNGPIDNPLLLDSNIMPGNSGGPAFRIPAGLNKYGSLVVGGRVAFLGIVTAGLEGAVQVGDQPLKMQRPGSLQPDRVGVVGVGALGKVEPAAKVRKLIEQILGSS